jgi:peptide/nickel transport system substrate-binding protein
VPVAKAKYGGKIRMSAFADVQTWDPLGSTVSSLLGYSQLYNMIVRYDSTETTKVTCDLCTKWDVSNGGQTFTFTLHDNVKWHNGQPLTAEDAVFSMERYMNPKVGIGRTGLFRSYTKPVEEGGVKLIDNKTVQFNLSSTSGAFLKFLALDYVKVLPKRDLQELGDIKQAETIIARKLGSGPFVLDEYKRGNGYRVSKNPNYFKEGRPFVDSIEHFIIVDTSALKAAFKAGNVEMMNTASSNLTASEYLQLDKDTINSPNGHVVAHELVPGTFSGSLLINIKKAPFTDPRVRKAIYLALDYQQLNNLVADGTGDSGCPFMGMGYTFEECAKWPGLRPKNTPGGIADIAFAKKLMADAGFPTGFNTKYAARQVIRFPDTCAVVKQQLQNALGILGEITVLESAAGLALFATSKPADKIGDWELACNGVGISVVDADAVAGAVYLKSAQDNYVGWETPFIRAKFEEQKVEQDVVKRRKSIKEIEDYLVPTDPNDISKGFEDNHWITLYWGKFFWLVHEDIRGFNPPQTIFYGMMYEDLWLDR